MQKLDKACKSWVKYKKVQTNTKRFVVLAACYDKKLILCRNIQLLLCYVQVKWY